MTARLKLAPAVAGARILGMGSVQPDNVVTNDDLAERMETNDQWIRDRVGIQSRRIADPEAKLVDLAAAAGELAIKDSGLNPTEIDTVIVASCTMPNPIPNAAAQTAYKLGMAAPAAFDLNAACAGYCYAMGTAADLVRAGSSRHVLVIGAEKLSDWLDWNDRSTVIIFADAAGATVVGPAAEEDAVGIGPVAWGSAGDMANAIEIRDEGRSRAGGGLYQEGQAVFRWATTQIAPVALRAIEMAGLTPADINVFVPHQANLRIIETVAKRLRSKGARQDMVVADDIVHSGNTSSASIPMALDHLRTAGRARSGDVVLLVGFGAGLSYAAQVVVLP